MLCITDLNEKELGVVLTPPKTTEYIISRLGKINQEHTILDPCVGPGIFIEKLLEIGIKPEQIIAFDINSEYKQKIEELGISFKVQDTLLTLYPDSYNQFDFVVGNPPYLNKASLYIRENKEKLKKIYGKINAHETYSMFIVNSIWRLKEGGKLGFITSDSFLTLSTHRRLRKFILSNCRIEEITLAPRNLFDNQKVSTSPVIIILTKFSGKKNKLLRENNLMRIIPRIETENDYFNPKEINEIQQKKYKLLPFNIFFTEVEKEIIDLFEKAPRIEQYLKGYIGMHTHNNLKYIAAVEGTELAEIFNNRNEKIIDPKNRHKIIRKIELNSDAWKPYFKRGGSDQYYRPIMEALDWHEKSIEIYDIPNNVPFEQEGIVISGVSSRLAARYMPKGCFWDSNKAIGFILEDKTISIEYMLGLLNSSLYNFLAKGIINNTNSIQITGIQALPFIKPDDTVKSRVEMLVKQILEKKENKPDYDYSNEQKLIDDDIFNFYAKRFNFNKELKRKLDAIYSIYKEN